MGRSRAMPGGDLEYAVMSALWDLGSASVREVHERVGEGDGLVYTTTAKVIDRLHAKRLVTRYRIGRSFVYRAAIAAVSLGFWDGDGILRHVPGVLST